MRENRAHLRSKYEFADLADDMADEPKVGWSFGTSSIAMALIYFCTVFAKGSYRTRLVKRSTISSGPNRASSSPTRTSRTCRRPGTRTRNGRRPGRRRDCLSSANLRTFQTTQPLFPDYDQITMT